MPISALFKHAGWAVALLVAGAVTGCDSTRNTAGSNAVTPGVCAAEWAAISGQPKPQWLKFNPDRRAFPAGFTVPLSYEAYRVDRETLGSLFARVRTSDAARIVVPLPAGCQSLSLRKSAAMSEELQRRFPDLVAAQGSGAGGTDLRLEWDGQKMNGQIMEVNNVYLITPVTFSGETIYLIYDKTQSGRSKQPFETPASETPKTNR